MSLHHWLIYVSVVLAVIVAPGPSAILCVSHGVAHGAMRTLSTIVGGMSASLTLMMLSALGLGAVIAASDTLFQVIKYLGAAYLVYLGVSTWRAPPQAFDLPADAAARSGASATGRGLFRKGFLVGIGNPKDLLFFSSLFPQFIDPGRPLVAQLLVLGATWLVVDGTVMMAYAKGGAALAKRLKGSRLGKAFNRITGGAFVVAGGALAVANR
ncbi:LysE family translocator [Piscinibacter gummiphilus]|uniref:Amino acid transporter n=1 Tax=Piscinibacter gummiphilus TaxID=946333 RepID=A0A1W6LAZ5_9BURK|nr:LysE family transporter [Piscinibacter gummiphilus]ARN21406.1 amino acid transporter [Piscinibacter gummiphilus]ATU66089.1 amino acid transporter [Piscinibacter gummiphilus]GLS96244.1 amino acid transporter [Piscinibacter gummiphilus]